MGSGTRLRRRHAILLGLLGAGVFILPNFQIPATIPYLLLVVAGVTISGLSAYLAAIWEG